MDACTAVEKEIDKIVSKLQTFEKHSNKTLQDLIDSVSIMEQELSSGDSGEMMQAHAMVLDTYIKKIKDVTSSLASQHRELHGTVSKVGKAIDKNFAADFAAISREDVFDGEKSQGILNQVICEHFLRKGYTDIGRSLMAEANVQVAGNYEEPFTDLNRILQALHQRNLQPALQWVAANREKLTAQRSQLELKLHRLQFINLLTSGASVLELCDYAKQNLQHLADRHEKDIQVMMGCLLFMSNEKLSRSPYASLLDNSMWMDICQVFARDACAVLGLAVESPLAVCVNAGCVAVPSLLNIKQVMQQRQVNVWCTNDELPIEIHLDRKHQFHSVFACPILRQQSSDQNPPMRLVCGHVISRDALSKLASTTKLKCPYCPVEQNPDDAREIYF